MRIFVVGSKPFGTKDEDFEDVYSKACREIGCELAKRRHEVAFGSLRETTADCLVIEGMRECDGKHSVHFFFDKSSKAENLEALADRFQYSVQEYKGNRHINALADSTVVLVLGGNAGTATTGFAAFALKRPVLALPKFGGAGRDIWEAVSLRYGRSLTPQSLEILSEDWRDGNASTVVDSLEALARNNPFDDRIQRPHVFLAVLAVTTILVWVLLFSHGGSDDMASDLILFTIVGVASVIGTVTRTFIKVYFELEEVYSSRRLLSDFILGIIMGFVFFLLVQATGVVVTGRQVELSSDDFRRLAILMSLVALAASFLLERSIEGFRESIGKYLDIESLRKGSD
jgi:hypothetical protein